MPTVIRKFGLVQGLKDLVDKWQRNSTVLVDLNVDHNIKRYDENIELAIFRIVQELTSNAIKHGESNYILIEIKTKPDGLHMLFEDNGNGFDVENATQTGGLGFQNINNRVAFLNGEMSASSTSSGSKFLFLFKVFPL
jgi:signal transduction histidine kinase